MRTKTKPNFISENKNKLLVTRIYGLILVWWMGFINGYLRNLKSIR
jgi:hypothetical protein